MFKAILWDIDGTLLDFDRAEEAGIRGCFQAFGLGECTDEMLKEYQKINRSYWQMLERGEIEKQVLLVRRFEDFLKRYHLNYAVAAAFNDEYQLRLGDTVVFCEHASETVQTLAGKILQCAVTNGTKVAQDRKLKNSGLDKLFDFVFISEEVGAEKPQKAFFDTVFSQIGSFKPEEILIVGDSLTSDIQGGINAGIKTCWFHPKQRNNTTGFLPDYEITDIKEVMDILNHR